MDYQYMTIIQLILIVIVVIVETMLILTMKKLIKSIEKINNNVNNSFNIFLAKINPIIKTLETTKPFIDFFNTIFKNFIGSKKRK